MNAADGPALPGTRRHVQAVAVGASAGGVEALQTLLDGLPLDFGAVLLVVLHVPPQRPSAVAGLLGRHCPLPVAEALDKQPLQPGTVVVAPPDYHLLVEPDRTVALSVDAPVMYSRPSIDLLFESASLAFGARLLAIVLTGANRDGARGAAAVRSRGGLVWVQDPREALVATMPEAVLQRADADAVLGLRDIRDRLRALVRGS
jgi:two-component system chemotaxis response regulator CheB